MPPTTYPNDQELAAAVRTLARAGVHLVERERPVRLLSLQRAARALDFSVDWVRDHKEELGAVKLGNEWRIDHEKLRRFLRHGT